MTGLFDEKLNSGETPNFEEHHRVKEFDQRMEEAQSAGETSLLWSQFCCDAIVLKYHIPKVTFLDNSLCIMLSYGIFVAQGLECFIQPPFHADCKKRTKIK